jgi:hypothetical protein
MPLFSDQLYLEESPAWVSRRQLATRKDTTYRFLHLNSHPTLRLGLLFNVAIITAAYVHIFCRSCTTQSLQALWRYRSLILVSKEVLTCASWNAPGMVLLPEKSPSRPLEVGVDDFNILHLTYPHFSVQLLVGIRHLHFLPSFCSRLVRSLYSIPFRRQ